MYTTSMVAHAGLCAEEQQGVRRAEDAEEGLEGLGPAWEMGLAMGYGQWQSWTSLAGKLIPRAKLKFRNTRAGTPIRSRWV